MRMKCCACSCQRERSPRRERMPPFHMSSHVFSFKKTSKPASNWLPIHFASLSQHKHWPSSHSMRPRTDGAARPCAAKCVNENAHSIGLWWPYNVPRFIPLSGDVTVQVHVNTLLIRRAPYHRGRKSGTRNHIELLVGPGRQTKARV